VQPADRHTEQARLGGGLVGAGAAQLRRAVGAEDQQRHRRVVRLEDGRMQVGDGRAGGGDDGDRAAGQLGQAEGQEPRGALVHAHVQPDPAGAVGLLQRIGQRRRARAGAQDSLADPVPRELVDEDGRQGGRGVHVPDPAASVRPDADGRACSTREWVRAGTPTSEEDP
jgi:hypothetical protein